MAGAPFMGRLLFCAKKICWKVHCLKRQSFTLVFSRGSNGLGNRRLERKIRANSISNFRLCADEKLDIVIYPVNPLEISAFACLSPAKSAQVHNPMADFQKKSPAGSGHKHFPKHKTGG